MARKGRAAHVSLEAQLQQLTLLSDIDSNPENVEQLGPIIKSLDEAQQQDEFLRHLRKFVRQKDEEIEVVCNENHQEFVSSVDQLLIVRSGTVSLKHRINELDQEIQTSGHALSTKKRDLIDKQKTIQNVDEALESLQECMHVLELSVLVEDLIQQRKYYSALRRLDELGNIHLKPLMHLEFARMLRDSIPEIRERIRLEVTKEMKGWMYDVREKSGAIGRVALETMEARQQRWRHRSQKDPMLRMSSINSPIEQVVNEKIDVNFLDNERVQVDFKPLYQCIHIYEVLDQREKLQTNYQEDRKAQANLLLSQNLVIHKGSRALVTLLEEVVGFFVVENHVMHTSPPGFRPAAEVEDLWETMCERVVDMVNLGLRDCQDTKAYIETKSAVQTFIRTLESLEFGVGRLNALLLNLFKRFAELLRKRFAADFHQAIREAQHQPMLVNDKDELAKVLNVCWLKPSEVEALQRQPFPLSLPFSQTYPLCCMDIRNLVEQYYNFSSGFTQYHREIDSILKQSLDELLVQQISVHIRATVEQSHNLSQIAQIIVNVEHFQLACSELEVWLANSRNPKGGGRLDLEASHHLAGTLEVAQKRIDTALFVKLDQFLDLLEYDWTPAVPKRDDQAHASSYIVDMIDWLSTMMESALVLLSPEAKAATFTSCFMHITSRLLNAVLLDRDVRMVNVNGLINFELDITYLYQFAKSLHIDGMDGVFGQVRQTLAVVLSESISEYALSPLARNQKFPQAQPTKVASILDKLVQYYTTQPGGTEAASKRLREREMVARLIRR
ncbi:Rab GTPase-binding exocyst subunit S15 [Malassezia furfur]|uniref:Exocyst complex component SEC15 n=1 Tax=Malassezia furfur TaxID=55194 RepID=A0ABY8EI33_MALFU|nr:SEC15 [Malassezia furfur]WFD45476.1 Rab GTPase-binding exocyst subunit S15 [Malassezia furfur]